MIESLAVFTIDMMNIMISLYNTGKISCDEFLKHAEMKIKFLRENTDTINFDSVQNILKEYERIVSRRMTNLQ